MFNVYALEYWCASIVNVLHRYDGSTREASFSIGLQGIAEEDMENIKQIIHQTIDDIIE